MKIIEWSGIFELYTEITKANSQISSDIFFLILMFDS